MIGITFLLLARVQLTVIPSKTVYLMIFRFVSFVCTKLRAESSNLRLVIDSTAYTDLLSMSFSFTSIYSATAYYISSLYLPLETIERVSSAPRVVKFDLFHILNDSSILGRLVAGFTTARFDPKRPHLFFLSLALWVSFACVIL